MMEVDVAPLRKKIATPAEEPARYLVLGDFGGRATDPLVTDRTNLSGVLSILQVAADSMPIRELEDFHPDRLFQRLEMDASSDEPAALSERMNALLHHPRFQALESAWRGIGFAVRQMNDMAARIHIAQYSDEDLAKDLPSDGLQATRLHALLHSRHWTAAIGLHSFHEENLELLGRVARLAADAGVPYLAEGSPGIAPALDELREIPESSHLGLALPRVLLRLPYGPRTCAIDSFEFEEMPGAPVHQHYLWGNAALACLAVLVRGDADNMKLEDLPAHTYKQDSEWVMTPCAEICLTETQVLALIDRGLMPLVCYADRPVVRLEGFRAVNSARLPFATPL